MFLPLQATLGSLIDDIEGKCRIYLEELPLDEGFRQKFSSLDPIELCEELKGLYPNDPENLIPEKHQRVWKLIKLVWKLRRVSESITDEYVTAAKLQVRKNLSPTEFFSFIGSLEGVDQYFVDRTEFENKETLASHIENGALIGPLTGALIAGLIRGEPVLKPGHKEPADNRFKKLACIEKVATIHHLWDVSFDKAITMLCNSDHWRPATDDPHSTIYELVKNARKEAKEKLPTTKNERKLRNYSAILFGNHPDEPRGCLKSFSYPEGLDKLKS